MFGLKIIRRLTLACCLILLTAMAAAVAAAQSHAIEPGNRIGKIRLGMTRKAVHAKLGQPDGIYRLAIGVTGDYWSSSRGGDSLHISYSAGKVFQIEATSNSFSTPEGLTTQSSLDEVRKFYGNLRRTSYFRDNTNGTVVNYYEATGRGITFTFVNLDSTTTPDNFKLYAIIVHAPGRRAVTMDEGDPDSHKL